MNESSWSGSGIKGKNDKRIGRRSKYHRDPASLSSSYTSQWHSLILKFIIGAVGTQRTSTANLCQSSGVALGSYFTFLFLRKPRSPSGHFAQVFLAVKAKPQGLRVGRCLLDPFPLPSTFRTPSLPHYHHTIVTCQLSAIPGHSARTSDLHPIFLPGHSCPHVRRPEHPGEWFVHYRGASVS